MIDQTPPAATVLCDEAAVAQSPPRGAGRIPVGSGDAAGLDAGQAAGRGRRLRLKLPDPAGAATGAPDRSPSRPAGVRGA